MIERIYNITTDQWVKWKTVKFPGGELNPKIEGYYLNCDVNIIARLNSSDDIMELILLVDAFRRLEVNNIYLMMPYCPYAQQDRVCNQGEALSIAVFAKLINSLNFKQVIIFDAHSTVAPAVIDNCFNIPPDDMIATVIKENPNIVLVAPDEGCSKKIEKIAKGVGYKGKIIQCLKSRNLENGELSNPRVLDDEYLKDNPNTELLIIDDICVGGRTFINLAQVFKEKYNISNIKLYVTHGIFSNGFEELTKYFSKIYTTNSFKDVDHPLVQQITLYESVKKPKQKD